jgi:hypothetical protein
LFAYLPCSMQPSTASKELKALLTRRRISSLLGEGKGASPSLRASRNCRCAGERGVLVVLRWDPKRSNNSMGDGRLPYGATLD